MSDDITDLYSFEHLRKRNFKAQSIFKTFPSEKLFHGYLTNGMLSINSTNGKHIGSTNAIYRHLREASRVVKMLKNITVVYGLVLDYKNNYFIQGTGYHHSKDSTQRSDTNSNDNVSVNDKLQQFDEVFYVADVADDIMHDAGDDSYDGADDVADDEDDHDVE